MVNSKLHCNQKLEKENSGKVFTIVSGILIFNHFYIVQCSMNNSNSTDKQTSLQIFAMWNNQCDDRL